ncbi:MAG: M48 family metalloprotease [Spirochaetia bacterium]|jgi:predicted Zn-dependent protease
MKTAIRAFPGLFLILLLAGCASLSTGSILDVVTDPNKRGAVVQAGQAVGTALQEITPEQEYYIGRAVAANILSTRKVWNDPNATTYLNVLERTLSLYSDRPETYGGYHLLIMDTDEINAFGAPGGLILVSRGLLRCATSEDMVAAILAHETSHVVKQHGLKAISAARWTAAGQAGLNAGVQVLGSEQTKQLTGVFKDSVNDITNTMVNSGYSRELEFDADHMALDIMRRAGYDPRAFEAMLNIMKTRLKPGGLDFAKTHPDPKDRAAAVEKALAGKPPVTVTPTAAAARQARYQAALGNI